MTDFERAAFRARTRRIFWLVALAGTALTAVAVTWKPPFAGTLALLVVIVGAFWVGRRHLVARFSQGRARPTSR